MGDHDFRYLIVIQRELGLSLLYHVDEKLSTGSTQYLIYLCGVKLCLLGTRWGWINNYQKSILDLVHSRWSYEEIYMCVSVGRYSTIVYYNWWTVNECFNLSIPSFFQKNSKILFYNYYASKDFLLLLYNITFQTS